MAYSKRWPTKRSSCANSAHPACVTGMLSVLIFCRRCESVLGQFLRTLKTRPHELELKHMINVLIVHAQSDGKQHFLSMLY